MIRSIHSTLQAACRLDPQHSSTPAGHGPGGGGSSSGKRVFDDCAGVPGGGAERGEARGTYTDADGGVRSDRRRGGDRRGEQASGTYVDEKGFERRRGPGRRLSDFTKAAELGELTQEQFLFIMAIETFKRVNRVQFPSWTDVLEVMRLLGYRKTMSSELGLTCAEDWRESGDSPSGVRSPRWEQHTQRVKDGPRREAA